MLEYDCRLNDQVLWHMEQCVCCCHNVHHVKQKCGGLFSLCTSTLLHVKAVLNHSKVLTDSSSKNICVCCNSLRLVLLTLNLSYIMYLTKHIMENNLCYALWYMCCWLAMLAVELQLRSFHGCPVTCQARTRGGRGGWSLALPILDLSARRGGWSMPRSVHLTPRDPVPIVQETGWALGPVLTGAENPAPTRVRAPDLPARRKSLYQLYPGPLFSWQTLIYIFYCLPIPEDRNIFLNALNIGRLLIRNKTCFSLKLKQRFLTCVIHYF